MPSRDGVLQRYRTLCASEIPTVSLDRVFRVPLVVVIDHAVCRPNAVADSRHDNGHLGLVKTPLEARFCIRLEAIQGKSSPQRCPISPKFGVWA